ncbi:unnamed protein product [Adineta ricciae]|uniref:G-protein coupled receptors family 1 profile domain-containing protein n=1 Tax=Adineta ricciae TaxID=249248 RepID=A0A814YR87_ADIRI|nr:unnamed protein product [Adineta ricciae]CAF1438960.1 unnamed protein product [Adineta ricciae]
MSSSASGADLITLLSNASTQINRYLAIFIFLFGTIGNIFNILVLTQKSLRSNPCTWLFLLSSIAFLISILAGVVSRFLSTWGADLTNTNQFLCKFRIFFILSSLTAGYWLIMLATVDRWLSSSVDANRRRISTLKNAQRGAALIIILSLLLRVLELICYEANLTDAPLKCYLKTALCAILADLSFALITILCPLLLMLIFGLMIISNVRQTRARLQPTPVTIDSRATKNTTISTGNEQQSQQRRMDRHLLVMLLVQVVLLLVITLPFAISKLYTTITRDRVKSTLQNITESFIFNLFLVLLFVASGMPFYIYTLTGGHVFRRTLFNLMQTFIQKLKC